MAIVIQFPDKFKKFGYKPVKKSKRVDMEKHGQLNLFNAPVTVKQARIIQLKSDLSPFEQALMMDDKGEAAAKDIYKRAIAEHDYTADAYCNLGIIESKEGNPVRAIDCFTNSLSETPRHFESHFNLANLYLDLDNLKLSKLHYQLAVEIQPDYPNMYFNLALVHAMLGELQESIACLKKFKALTTVSEHKIADDLLKNLQLSLVRKN